MKRHLTLPRSVQPAVIGFLVLVALAVASAVAKRAGLIDASVARRAGGVLVGLMAIVTGNYLPKMRPLGTMDGRAAIFAEAERTAGWILVFQGAAFVGLFAFAPIDLARSVSPVAGLGGAMMIAGDWLWVARVTRSPASRVSRSPLPQNERASERRTIAAWLLFACAYVLVTASLKLLTDGAPWVRELGSWSVVVFTGAYSLLYVLLGRRRRAE